MGKQVKCAKHGEQPETFVCRHIFESLSTGVAVGFFHAGPDDERGDAWCAGCERAHVATGSDTWTDEVMELLDIRLICGACYDDAKAIWTRAAQAAAGSARPPAFAELPNFWVADGSLRDLSVLDTSFEDWRRFMALAATFPCTFKRDGAAVQRLDLDVALRNQHPSLMRIQVGNVRLHCHFFDVDEIELDIDPREIKNAADHDAVTGFMERLGKALGKTVALTPENEPETPVVVYQPSDGTWRWRADWLGETPASGTEA